MRRLKRANPEYPAPTSYYREPRYVEMDAKGLALCVSEYSYDGRVVIIGTLSEVPIYRRILNAVGYDFRVVELHTKSGYPELVLKRMSVVN